MTAPSACTQSKKSPKNRLDCCNCTTGQRGDSWSGASQGTTNCLRKSVTYDKLVIADQTEGIDPNKPELLLNRNVLPKNHESDCNA